MRLARLLGLAAHADPSRRREVRDARRRRPCDDELIPYGLRDDHLSVKGTDDLQTADA